MNPNRAEAERLLGIAEKLLQTRDLTGSREFALLAQETEPLLEGSDQILAITDVLLASEHRVVNNRHYDWYGILQINRQSLSSDPDLLKKNYRRLALLLHPDKNRYPLADSAFKLVADAWALLSDHSRRGLYDHELNVYEKVELPRGGVGAEKDKLPVRRSPRGGVAGGGDESGFNSSDPSPPPAAPNTASGKKQNPRGSTVGAGRGGGATGRMTNFWTACPYCYVLYEFPRAYEDCCLRCQNCERAYHATVINSLPPMVPGKEAYYCCWGFFPLGFSLETTTKGKKKVGSNQDGMFTTPAPPQGGGAAMNMNVPVGGIDISDGSASAGLGNNNNVSAGFPTVPPGMGTQSAKKRGRPRKNPLPV
uniref:J domain-containing protein n=1 Tax=Chenopodium quinoa TaxID=63459 RepID=A0A803MEI7_CHEQI